jgi:hypothetical protein
LVHRRSRGAGEGGPVRKDAEGVDARRRRDYLTANKDKRSTLDGDGRARRVASLVQVLGPLSTLDRAARTFVAATCRDLTDGFLGRFMPLEDFMSACRCVSPTRTTGKRFSALLSNVKHETVKTALDDGVTQVVQARAGVALVIETSPCRIRCCSAVRAFRDVVQPSSLFVLRVQGGRAAGFQSRAV